MPISNPIRFVDLGQYGFLTDEDLDAIEDDVTANTDAISNLGNTFAPVGHNHSYAPVSHSHSYAAVNHNHTLGRWVAVSGRNHLRVRRSSNTTSGEVPVMDTDGRCKYFHWSSGVRFAVQVDASWIFLNPAPSDRRFKINIENRDTAALWQSALLGLLAIPLSSYSWDIENFPAFNGERVNLGVIAQDLESINPDLIDTDPDGYKHVNITNCVIQLVAAIKGLNLKVDELEARLSAAGS